jgi:hypothetical protein
MKIHLNNNHSVGLGDHLCLISLLCDINDGIEVLSSNNHGIYDRLCYFKRVLHIPDSAFTLKLVDSNGDFDVIGWPLKLFSKYYQPETVTLKGLSLRVDDPNHPKPAIGLACFTTNYMYLDNNSNYVEWLDGKEVNRGNENVFPQCRLRPASYYARIFEYCKTHRYDVITIDSMHTDLEEKIEMMVKNCKAIIGYEGGMAHLAHILNIPYFMLDWKLPTPNTVFNEWHCELVHQTNSLYVLRDDEELFKWSADEFDKKIHLISRGNGNNRLLNGECRLHFDSLTSPLTIQNDKGETVFSTDFGMFSDNAVGRLLAKYYSSKFH